MELLPEVTTDEVEATDEELTEAAAAAAAADG